LIGIEKSKIKKSKIKNRVAPPSRFYFSFAGVLPLPCEMPRRETRGATPGFSPCMPAELLMTDIHSFTQTADTPQNKIIIIKLKNNNV
jgi:hypothetical protein